MRQDGLARAGENVPRTARPGPGGLPLALRLSEGLGVTRVVKKTGLIDEVPPAFCKGVDLACSTDPVLPFSGLLVYPASVYVDDCKAAVALRRHFDFGNGSVVRDKFK